MNEKAPLVSVILPVYNCETYLATAIDSILKQTFTDFELIVINDGSKDNSEAVARSFSDPRVIVFSHENRGLPLTLNRGIELAKGAYIARMDADDVARVDRLQTQMEFLKNNLKVGLIGSWARIIETDRLSNRELRHPVKNNDLQFFLCFNNPFVHASVVFRKDIIEKAGVYSAESERQPEDYDMWIRIAKVSKIANIPDYLIDYREVGTSISRAQADPFPFVPNIGCRHVLDRSYGLFPKDWVLHLCQVINSKARPKNRVEYFRNICLVIILFLIFRPSLGLFKHFFMTIIHSRPQS